jgi:hypothetical protein
MSSSTLTFDDSPPRRPSLDDVGGGQKVNATTPPDPVAQATAEDFNQISKQVVAHGALVPLARLFVTFSAGVPSITGMQSPSADLVVGDFTVTDNATGDTTISWIESSLPQRAAGPIVSQIDDVDIDKMRAFNTTASGNPAVRVKSFLGGAGTDANFVLDIL